jgi:hypothetical protein
MKAIIFDTKGNYRETIKGFYEKGIFKYKEGIFRNKNVDLAPIDYEKTYIEDKERKVFLEYDGANYKQLSFESAKNISVPIDKYIDNFKIAHLTAEHLLKKPDDFKNITEWILLILVGILGVISYFTAHTAYQQSQINYAGLNKTINAFNTQTHLLNYLIMKRFNITNINQTAINKLPILNRS